MKHLSTACLILFLLFPFSRLFAVEYETVFFDNFQSESLENWLVQIGEWSAGEARLCQLSCGS